MDTKLPEDCDKQYEVLLLLIASEEKKIDRTNENEIETMQYFLNNEGVKQILLQWLMQMEATCTKTKRENDTTTKCDEVALMWRQQGNDKFRADHLECSYECYTKSVMYAHQNGPKYPLALANRSAALLRLKRLEDCLADIELAILSGYPTELRYKLMLRKADCFIELKKRDKASDALTEASQQAMALKLTAAQKEELNRQIKVLEKKLKVLGIDEPSADSDVLPECYKGENPDFIAASSVLQLRCSETVGRHVETREALRRGDVVFSEDAYAWVPVPTSPIMCDACCAPEINPIPCTTCSRVAYCNYECRARGFEYHQWECTGSQAELFSVIGMGHLALRVLLKSTISGYPPVPPQCQLPASAADLFSCYSNVDNINIYNKDTPSFYRMFNLLTNFDKINNMVYIQYALVSTTLILYLEHFTQFFNQLPAAVPYALSQSELRLFAGALMLRTIGQGICNAHAIVNLTMEDDGDVRSVVEREELRAVAIYPSVAMMNHSCDPNIINTFNKTRLIVKCARELPSGGEVLNCYGPHRAKQTTSRRRYILRERYYFTCSCSACLDTERKDFVLIFSAHACFSCKGPMVRGATRTVCSHCGAPYQPQKAAHINDEAEALLAQVDRRRSVEDRIEKTNAAYRLKQIAWYRHSTTIRKTASDLALLYAEQGEYGKSIELIKQNLQSAEYQYGSFSIEVANVLWTLAELMLERTTKTSSDNPCYRDWCLETHKILKKAVQLIDLYYGSWEPTVKYMKQQELIAAALVAGTQTTEDTDNIHHTLQYKLKI